jgi:hypothetical protein
MANQEYSVNIIRRDQEKIGTYLPDELVETKPATYQRIPEAVRHSLQLIYRIPRTFSTMSNGLLAYSS